MRPWVLLVSALLLAGLAGPAWAKGSRHGPGRGGPPPLERLLERHAERLGLDEPTLERIEGIAEEARPQRETLRAELRAQHEAMRALLGSDAPEEASVMRQAERIGAAETALQKQRLRTMLRIRALLTDAQRAELVRIHEERRTERRREHRGGPPSP